MSHKMSRAEREEFLAGVHVGVMSVSLEATKSLALPIWYSYTPGGDVAIITGPSSVKGRALEATERFSLCAQEEAPPYKYVVVEGPVTSVVECDEEFRRSMAHRYLGAEFGDLYLESTADQAAGSVYNMTPEHWYTVDYAKDLES